jgi:hypothetical protein
MGSVETRQRYVGCRVYKSVHVNTMLNSPHLLYLSPSVAIDLRKVQSYWIEGDDALVRLTTVNNTPLRINKTVFENAKAFSLANGG